MQKRIVQMDVQMTHQWSSTDTKNIIASETSQILFEFSRQKYSVSQQLLDGKLVIFPDPRYFLYF